MLKLLGSILLMGGASMMGFLAAANLKARVTCLRSFISAIEYMERELAFRLTPIHLLFAELEKKAHAPVDGFFVKCAKKTAKLGEKSMSEMWREMLLKSTLPLEEEEMQTLLEIGDILGRYDGDGQRKAFDLARERLSQYLSHAVEEQNRLGNVYAALGVSAGAFLLLVFL